MKIPDKCSAEVYATEAILKGHVIPVAGQTCHVHRADLDRVSKLLFHGAACM